MKRLSRVLALVLVMLLVLNGTAFAATDYHRYTPSDWSREAAAHLLYYGIIDRNHMSNEFGNGFAFTQYYRYDIPRSMIAYLLVSLYEFETGTQIPVPEDYPLNPPLGWDNTEDYVKKAYGVGLMQGVSPTDFGYTYLTRQEFAVVLYRAAKIFGCADADAAYPAVPSDDAASIDAWAQDGARYAYYNGYMTGVSESEFAPKEYLSREMALTCLHRFALKNGLYEKLSDSVLNEISFVMHDFDGISLEELCLAVSGEQAAVIRKAMELFPDPYTVYAYAGDYDEIVEDWLPGERDKENGEFARLGMCSEKGDFFLILTQNGIYAGMSFSNKEYAKYKELVDAVIEMSRDKDSYFNVYEDAKYFAEQSENGWAYRLDGKFIIGYDKRYEDMTVTISDLRGGSLMR